MCKKYCIRCDKRVKGDSLVCKRCDGDICINCENMGYIYDSGYGLLNFRFVDENNDCEVCHSDPYKGEHREWFIVFSKTHEECKECHSIKEVDDECERCYEIEMKKEMEENNEEVIEDEEEEIFFKKLRRENLDRRAFRDISEVFENRSDERDLEYYSDLDYSEIDEVN